MISKTLRYIGNDIWINADGLRTDRDGVPVSGSGGSSATTPLTGTGSPEGVKTADPGTTYLDTSTNGFWVKATGTGNTGWQPIVT